MLIITELLPYQTQSRKCWSLFCITVYNPLILLMNISLVLRESSLALRALTYWSKLLTTIAKMVVTSSHVSLISQRPLTMLTIGYCFINCLKMSRQRLDDYLLDCWLTGIVISNYLCDGQIVHLGVSTLTKVCVKAEFCLHFVLASILEH